MTRVYESPAPGMPGLLAGKVVVISGVGPGLGRSLAVQAAKAGADLVLASRTESRLEKVAAEVTTYGVRAITVASDVTSDESAANLLARTTDAFGRVDGLINNAFAIPPLVGLLDTEVDAIRAGFEASSLGALRITRTFTPLLTESRGSVVMVNSAVIRHSRVTFGAYKMAKSSLMALAQSLATELGPRGIRVNTVAPGYIWGPNLKYYFDMLAKQRGISAEEVYDEIAAPIDLRKLPDSDEVADPILFLLSDLARAITGQCLDVNGGEFHH